MILGNHVVWLSYAITFWNHHRTTSWDGPQLEVTHHQKNMGIEKGQWGHWKNPVGGVNGGIGQVNGGMEKGSMVELKLVRVNGGVGHGQWGHWEGSGQTGAWLWVRQGCGCGSDRGVAVLQKCKLYLTGLQALPCRVVSSTLQGCKLYLTGLQALPCRVVSSTLQGCKLYLPGL